MKTSTSFSGLLEGFFTDRLVRQRRASPYTIASYRDTFRLLLRFAHDRLKKAPAALDLPDLDAPLIGAFLDHIEKDRGVTARSRNVRLAAIRSFFRYVALQEPKHSAVTQRVLAMPNKRFDRRPIGFLTRPEIEAMLAAPDRTTRSGRRDHALLLLAVQTGLRCSELAGLRIEDVVLAPSPGAHVRCRGKGRKERCTPVRKATVEILRSWLRERGGGLADPVFPNARGGQFGPDGIEYVVAKHVAVARRRCSSLKRKRVTPHVLRHTAAMELLQSGVDRAVIALCLGHESVETTQIYLDADLALKEKALSRTAPMKATPRRFRPGDRLLEFLKSL
ncbi:MAG: site-specific integrase [Planctomycetes bacterium]|nr:site-specific integrase [Planctomycetota bacterium]